MMPSLVDSAPIIPRATFLATGTESRELDDTSDGTDNAADTASIGSGSGSAASIASWREGKLPEDPAALSALYASEAKHLEHKERGLFMLKVINALNKQWCTSEEWVKARSANPQQAAKDFERLHFAFTGKDAPVIRKITRGPTGLTDKDKRSLTASYTMLNDKEYQEYLARKDIPADLLAQMGLTPIVDPADDVKSLID